MNCGFTRGTPRTLPKLFDLLARMRASLGCSANVAGTHKRDLRMRRSKPQPPF